MNKNKLSTNFENKVSDITEQLVELSKTNENIIVGTKEKPIVTDSKKVPIKHFFMKGVYVREMTMYKGTVVVGAIHKDLHMCFLLKGHLTIASEQGAKDYIAPCYIIAEPGTRRVLYSHEDSVWYNTHRNPENLKEIKDIEDYLVSTSFEDYKNYVKNNKK
jgi:hypothetical protein